MFHMTIGFDFFEQGLIGPLPREDRPFAPVIIPASRNSQHLTHKGHLEFFLVVFDELKSHDFGLLKMATVFLNISILT